jgi:hypothetical protein
MKYWLRIDNEYSGIVVALERLSAFPYVLNDEKLREEVLWRTG